MATTTLSARFDEDELELLKKAADAKGWSLAQLIRDAAYEKAANIINSRGPAGSAVRRILADMETQLLRPGLCWPTIPGSDEAYDLDPDTERFIACGELCAARFSEMDFMRLVRALGAVGAEAAVILEEEHRRACEDPLAELIDPVTRKTEPFDVSVPGESEKAATKKCVRRQPPVKQAEAKAKE